MAVDYAALKKGGFMRQKQKNNFSLRLQVVGGNLTAENLVKIAEVAEKYGDGHVHLTSRQSVEIPFIKIDDVDEVKEELADVINYCLLMADKLGVDPKQIVLDKMEKTAKKYPIEKAKGKSTKYNKL